MRKTWTNWTTPMLLVVCGLMATACDTNTIDADDDGGVTPGSALVVDEHLRLVNVDVAEFVDEDVYKDKYTFNYDAQGRLVRMYESYDDEQNGIKFSYQSGNNKFTFFEDTDDVVEGYVSYTQQGYVKSATATYSLAGNSWKDSGSFTIKFNYDANGHLTKTIGSYQTIGYEIYDGEKYDWNESAKGESTFQWANDVLEKAYSTYEETDKEDDYTEIEKWVCNVTYYYNKNYTNHYKQCSQSFVYPLSIASEYFSFFIPTAFVGMLGKGSAKLPSTIEAKWVEIEKEISDGDTYEDSDSWTDEYDLEYVFNGNGTIALEEVNGVDFVYNYANSTSPYAVARQSAPSKELQQPMHRQERRARTLRHVLKQMMQ